jgi:hypothetical protein
VKLLLTMLALAALALIGVAVFALLNLGALVGAHREELVARVERVVGRPLTVGAVAPSWWPLGIRLREVVVQEDREFGSVPFLAADGVVMAVRPWPLVQGRIEAAGIVLDRPRLRLARDLAGRWNVASLGSARASEAPDVDAPRAKEKRRSARVPLEWVVGVALSDVYDGTLTIDDRYGTARPPLVLRNLRLHAEDIRLGATARVRIAAALLATAGTDVHLDLRVSELGQHDVADSPFTARLELADVDLAAASAALGRQRLVAGRLRDLAIDATGTLDRLRADVALRTDAAQLRVGRLRLPDVAPLEVTGRVARDRERLVLEDLRATIGGMTVRGSGDVDVSPWRMTLALDSDPGGVGLLGNPKTPLRLRAFGGRFVVDRNGVGLEPLTVELDGVSVEARGWITGVDTPAFDVRLEARPFDGTVAADVAVEPSGNARARVEVVNVDLAPAVARLAPQLGARMAGRATGAAALTGRVADGAVIGSSVAGSGTISIEAGRLYGVNVPELVIDQIERVPFMPQLVSARTRKRYAELFASRDTVVESARLPFTVGRGRFTTENALLVNPAYQIRANGWIDRAYELRWRGDVVLGASVSRTLRDDVRAAKYFLIDDGRIALPFVARGRPGRFTVEPDAKRLRRRGLTALLGESFGTDGGRGAGARTKPRDDEPLEDKMLERLERMIHP